MRAWLPLLFFLATVAARLPVLLAHLDTWYPFEVHCGTIAVAFQDHLDLNWATLPIVDHIRGNVIDGLLLWPIFTLFGVSSLTLKLVPLFWHAATVALLVHLLARYANRYAAIAGGVLLVLAPPSLQKLSVLGLASHMESTLPFLLALWPWLHMTTLRRFGPLPALLFGAATGFAAFYHVQALLPCLVLLGLLLAAELPALGLRGVLALALGFAVCAAPSMVFKGGNMAAIELGFSGPTPTEAAAPPGPSVVGKALGLFTGGLAVSLEYGEVPGTSGSILAGVATACLLLLPLLAAVIHRQRLVDLTLRVFRRRPCEPPGLVPPLVAYALVLMAAYAGSFKTVVPYVGTGASNRFIAPLVFTLLMLEAIALGSLAQLGWRRAANALFALAAVPGAFGLMACGWGTAASHVLHRGECYEWFHSQLEHASGGKDSLETIQLISRVDRGDPRFRTLRFRVTLPHASFDDPQVIRKEQRARANVSAEAALFSLTNLGTVLLNRYKPAAPGARAGEALSKEDFWQQVEEMDAVDAAALMHGVGLALMPPRLGEDSAAVDAFVAKLSNQLRNFPPRFADLAAEGYGFNVGFVFDPYNILTCKLVEIQERLPEEVGDAVYRGIGWGYRQRFLVPPTTVTDGQVILDWVPESRRPAFTAALVGEVLPAEAERLAP